MRLKTKISFGLSFLFSIFLLVSGLGIYYLNLLSKDAEVVLRENNDSIEYAKEMLKILDEYRSLIDSDRRDEKLQTEKMTDFRQYLLLQEKNITEVGEKSLTNQLRDQYERLKNVETNAKIREISYKISALNNTLYKIMDLNRLAITRKNRLAKETAQQAIFLTAVITSICFLLAFSFVFNFPSYVANPILEMTESIKKIAHKDYNQQLRFNTGDEFEELADAFNLMTQQLNEYENSNLAQIIFEKQRTETIINNMKDPLIGLDENNTILFVNNGGMEVLGQEKDKLVGRYAPDVALNNDLLRTLLTQNTDLKPLKIYANKRESYFKKEVLEINSNDQSIGQVIVLRDITDFQERDLAKTNFIATISHELKTPIAAIKMSLKLLENEGVGKLNEEQQKLIGQIKEDSQRLLKITGELLDLSQVESGNLQLKLAAVNPKLIVDYAIHTLQFQAEQKEVVLEAKIDSDLSDVYADFEKTTWVLINLLSNAIRYSPVDAKVIICTKDFEDKLLFSVKDLGSGIAKAHQEKIFEKFYQAPHAGSNNSGGVGLGLAISKEFIDAQGGEIWVESVENEGATFWFSLKKIEPKLV
jgi:PAS domain S-box-containing protein